MNIYPKLHTTFILSKESDIGPMMMMMERTQSFMLHFILSKESDKCSMMLEHSQSFILHLFYLKNLIGLYQSFQTISVAAYIEGFRVLDLAHRQPKMSL